MIKNEQRFFLGMLMAFTVFLSFSQWVEARQIVESRGGKVKVVKYDDGAWELLAGGKPYFIQGMVFTPVPIGKDPGQATMRDWMLTDEDRDGRNDIAFQTWFDENRNGKKDPGEPTGDFNYLKKNGRQHDTFVPCAFE